MFLEIPFSEAFSFAISHNNFLRDGIVATILAVAVSFFVVRAALKKQEWSITTMLILFAMVAAILYAWMSIPAGIAANTHPEQALQGVYIW